MKVLSIADIARRHIEEAIIKGNLKPGAQIKEEHIASFLEISRPPIREAFKHLEVEGLVVRKPRRGVFVAETTIQDVWEIYTLKAELYSFSIHLCFDRITDSDVRRMEVLLREMETCVQAEQSDIFSYQELNTRFHNVHVDAAGHRRIKQMLHMLHNQIRHFSYNSLSNNTYLQKSLNYHHNIFQAFYERDLAAAIKWSREHVLVGLKKLQKNSGDSFTKPDINSTRQTG